MRWTRRYVRFHHRLFLYKEVLRLPLSGLGAIPSARAPVRLPVVLTAEEVRSVLEQMRRDEREVL